MQPQVDTFARREMILNHRKPLALLITTLVLLSALSISGCSGLTSAGTPAGYTNSSTDSSTALSGMLAASATSLNFGNVTAGSNNSQTLTLTNTGTATVTISQGTITGAGFSVVGGMSSVSIAPGQNHVFQVQFAPPATGNVTASMSVASDATNSPLSISLSGTGVTGLSIITQPANQIVAAGQTATFSVTATGNGTLNYQWKRNGTAIGGATSSTYTTPATSSSDSAAQFTVVVTDSSGSVTSNAATLTVNAATCLLNANTTSLNFASVNLGSNSILGVTFTNAGNSNVTISGVSISGAGYAASGVSTGQILTPGQTVMLNVTFTPSAAGNLTGTATVASNATNSPASISLSGTGVQSVSHFVTLSWIASTSVVSGYNAYRSSVAGGPFSKLNSTPITTTQYTNSSVLGGQTYYYAVTSLDPNNVESAYSNETSATIP